MVEPSEQPILLTENKTSMEFVCNSYLYSFQIYIFPYHGDTDLC